VADKISMAEARARRTDPIWRRRHKQADLVGAALIAVLLIVPPLGAVVWPPLRVALALGLLVGGPATLWWQGPSVGLERRAALLVAVPVLNLMVLVPAVWRAAHLHLQHWQGPLEPRWNGAVWIVVGAVGVVMWLVTVAGLALSLA